MTREHQLVSLVRQLDDARARGDAEAVQRIETDIQTLKTRTGQRHITGTASITVPLSELFGNKPTG